MRSRSCYWLSAAALVVALLAGSARADVFVFELASGGRVEGEWLNQRELGRKAYLVRTELGELTLTREQVRKSPVLRSAASIELEKIRHTFPDTPEGQWQLADWSRKNGLRDEVKRFAERVIELDPDHLAARSALGYSKYDGQWKTFEQAQLDKGLVKHKGKWMLPQEAANQDQQDRDEVASKVWIGKVKTWCDWVASGSRFDEGRQALLDIHDPLALRALHAAAMNEPADRVRLICVRALANVASHGAPTAWRVLAERALDDPVEEIRQTCLDYISATPRPEVVKFLVDQLRHKDNVRVNRAGAALGRVKDPTTIPALIDALVTAHDVQVSGGSGGSTSATFSPQLGSGIGVGGGGPQYVRVQTQNQSVHDALNGMTGVSFGFDVATWKKWRASRGQTPAIGVRRD